MSTDRATAERVRRAMACLVEEMSEEDLRELLGDIPFKRLEAVGREQAEAPVTFTCQSPWWAGPGGPAWCEVCCGTGNADDVDRADFATTVQLDDFVVSTKNPKTMVGRVERVAKDGSWADVRWSSASSKPTRISTALLTWATRHVPASFEERDELAEATRRLAKVP